MYDPCRQAFEGVLAKIDGDKADASFPRDRERIRRLIVKSGGFKLLDAAVREVLRGLFMQAMNGQIRAMHGQMRAQSDQVDAARTALESAGIPASPLMGPERRSTFVLLAVEPPPQVRP